MKKTLILGFITVASFSSIASTANTVINVEKETHHFSKSEVTLKTTATYTYYNYGEPVVRFYESLDEIVFSKDQSQKLYPELAKFYKVEKKGDFLQAKLNTNYYGFVDDIIEITCSDQETCSISYNQDLKERYLLDKSNPQYEAGLIGRFVNNFGKSNTLEAKENLKSFKEQGYIDEVISFREFGKKDVYELSIENGALPGLLNDAKLCDRFIKYRCGKNCSGGYIGRSRDVKSVGTCYINLQ